MKRNLERKFKGEIAIMEKDPFKEYLRESEPDKAHKGYVWSTAIGLQAFKDTWILCNQCYFCGKCVVFQKCTCPCKLYEPVWCRQILLSQYLGTEKENINSRNN